MATFAVVGIALGPHPKIGTTNTIDFMPSNSYNAFAFTTGVTLFEEVEVEVPPVPLTIGQLWPRGNPS